MATTLDMEKKSGWNFSAFESISGAFDALTPAYGEKAEFGSIACFLALCLTETQRKEMRRLLRIAAVEAENDGGTVLEHLRKLARPVTITPPTVEPTLPPSRQSSSVEAEIRKQALGMVDAQAKKEADQKGKKRAG